MPQARIKAVAAYMPDRVVRPDDYLKQINCEKYDIAPDFVSRICGIRELRRFDEGIESDDAALKACWELLDCMQGPTGQITGLIFCGMRPRYNEHPTASGIAKALGLEPNECYDLTNACMGVSTAMNHARVAIESGAHKAILICASERHEHIAADTVTRINNHSFEK